ncbi:hypothetical protein H6F76_10050 [Leptolyngbya sp. FACHB-321]|uniref:hypothetical protein n=1 Tax=Leptolyngbya sp. FACHB-321 TaxID=2692807 RepID=UPI00168657C6|nr:hypothetical protein [Leptolyngbya sp. FACHB-321]MBD2035364.1 hypothetical protein [Leptolyngbya sp. FACHB-321]
MNRRVRWLVLTKPAIFFVELSRVHPTFAALALFPPVPPPRSLKLNRTSSAVLPQIAQSNGAYASPKQSSHRLPLVHLA